VNSSCNLRHPQRERFFFSHLAALIFSYMSTAPRFSRHEAALLGTILIWGANFPIFKGALVGLHPHLANALRFVFAVTVLTGVYIYRVPQPWATFVYAVKRYGWTLFGLTMLGYVLYQLAFVMGVSRTSAGSAALLMATSPLWTALLGHITRVERLPTRTWVGLMASMVGAMVVVGAAAGSAQDSVSGNILMLAAAMLWGAYTVLSRPLLGKMSPVVISYIEIVMALPFLFLIALPYANWATIQTIDLGTWGALIYSGALSIGVAFILWNAAVQKLGPGQTVIYANLTPFVALLFSAWWLGEVIRPTQIVGGALIVSGLMYVKLTRSPLPRD